MKMDTKPESVLSEHALDDTEPEELEGNSQQAEGDSGVIKLSDSIVMFSDNPICSSAHIYHGLLKRGLFGDQKIAVKYIPLNDDNVREAEVLHGLGLHPNVVILFHAGVRRAGPFPAMYIAMERCQRLNLHDRILQNKKYNVPFNPGISLSQSKQVAFGVDFIHIKGIIHRDLKPQNILISENGNTLKIADFGLSKPLKKGRSVTKQSMRGIGTDGYRAPETYNDDVISQSSDIYSLALVFYFIWSYGCHPFGDDPDDWNSNIKKNRDRDLTHILIKDKDPARNLLEWMLQFLQKNRPTTMQILKHLVFNKSEEILQVSMEAMSLNATEENTNREDIETDLKTNEGTTPSVQNEEKLTLEAILEEEQCQELISDGKYVQALLKLNGLVQRGRSELSIRLMIAECNLQIGREKVAENVIAGIRQEMLSQNRTIQEYQALVDEYINQSFHVRALIMLPCLCELIASNWLPNQAVDHIERCIRKMNEAIETFVEKKGRWVIIAYQIGFPSIHKMLECFRTVEGANPEMRAVEEARCLDKIGDCYYEVDQYHEAITFREEGLAVMRQQFGDRASRYVIFGNLLHNVGVSKRLIGKYDEANECYEQAIQAAKEATDFSSEEDRQESIAKTVKSSLLNKRKLMTE